MYTSEQAAGVTWGAIAALLGTFRSEHPLLSFDFVKILRIIRLAELQSFDVNEDLVTASQVVPPNDARLGMTLAALKKEAVVELLKDIQTAEARIKRLKDLGMITTTPHPSQSKGQFVSLTPEGRATLEKIEQNFCALFDLLIIQRNERHAPASGDQDAYTAAQRALCDPFSTHHQLPRPAHNRKA